MYLVVLLHLNVQARNALAISTGVPSGLLNLHTHSKVRQSTINCVRAERTPKCHFEQPGVSQCLGNNLQQM